MDNLTAKERLAVRRPGGQDALDPHVREAIEQAEADPALRAWAVEEVRFDLRMTEALHALPVPRDGKRLLLSSAAADVEKSNRPLFGVAWMALAATLVLAFALWSTYRPARGSFSLASMVHRGVIFEHRADSPEALADWLVAQGAAAPDSLPMALLSAEGLGCKRFNDGGGGTISLMCLELDGKLVHVFVFDASNRDLLPQMDGVVVQDKAYSTLAWTRGEHRIAIATQDAPMAERLSLQKHAPLRP